VTFALVVRPVGPNADEDAAEVAVSLEAGAVAVAAGLALDAGPTLAAPPRFERLPIAPSATRRPTPMIA
jgi:hypothetical protein